MSDEEPIHGPAVSAEWLRDKRERLIAEAETAEFQEHNDWLAEIQERAQSEIRAWSALPCAGEVETVGRCPDSYAASCERREHVMCPRRQVAVLAEEQREKRRQLRRQLKASGVPLLDLENIIDRDPLETPSVAAIRQIFEQTPKPILVILSGGIGCGKTSAAVWWLGQVGGGEFVTAIDFAAISDFDKDAQARLRSTHLVLDDLGVEYMDKNGKLLSALDGLMNHRYGDKLPTVATTNLKWGEFRARYGVRIADRIRQLGVFVEVAGASLRRKPVGP